MNTTVEVVCYKSKVLSHNESPSTDVLSTETWRIVIARAKPEAIRYSGVFRIASQARNDVKTALT